jgi:Kdo2-lipid IVA lauroyltransferase/acyltransferase
MIIGSMLSFFRWISRRPLRLLHALGAALGWLTWALSPSYRRRFAANVQRAGLAPERVRPAIAEAGRMVAELPFLWLRPAERPISPLVRWEGTELIERALAGGAGLLFLTPHLGAFEVCAQAYAERFGARSPMTVLYRPARKAWLRELETTARDRPGLHTAPATLAGVRQMVRVLRAGGTVGLLPDQVPPEGLGVWAPFFGERAYTMTLAARMVQMSGAHWLLATCERLPRGAGYVLRVSEPAEALPAAGADEAAHQSECATVINRAMEHLILQLPQQYLWGYHRYKSPRAAL